MIDLLRRNRDIRLLFFAQVVSYLGDWFTFVALAGLVEDYTGSKFLVSVVFVSMTLPTFLFSPIAGVVADRFDRRRILVWVSLGQAAAALGVLTATESRIWVAFFCQATIASLAAFVAPASSAAVPNLVDSDDDLRRANSLLGSTWGVMLAVGAGIGGVFAELFGRSASFVADAATFLVAALLVAGIRRPMQRGAASGAERPPMRPLADMAEAVLLARRNTVVLALLASKTSFAVGAGLVSQLPVLASQTFGSGDVGRGLLIAARGVGSGLGPIVAARYAGREMSRILTVCGTASLVFSFAYLGAAASPHIAVAALCVAIAHFGGGAQWTISTYGLQMESPDALRGRVMAGDFALVTLTLAITGLAAGAVSEWAGARWTLIVFSAVAAATGTTYLVATRSLRRSLRSGAPRR